MSGNVRQLRRQSNLGFTQVESVADVPLALFEMEGECDQLLIELGEIEKLGDERVNVFVGLWRERLAVMRDRAQACQRAFEDPMPSLAVVT
jgi:hypothetical protein